MSFKYRFILSFVLLEVVFIVLIVSVNFFTIKNSSNQLTKEKINSNIAFLEQLAKVPISIYDIATLDNLVNNAKKLEYINSIVILDNQNRLISHEYDYKYEELKSFINIKKDRSISINDEIYDIKYKNIYEDDILLGSMYIVFDSTLTHTFISENKRNTIFIIIIEILISTVLAYILGARLTKRLSKLSIIAAKIGENKHPTIPYLNVKNEIGILANSMNQMQIDLKNRNDKLKDFTKTLKQQKSELEQLNKHKSDFLANMSHELKTPLNSINVISSIMINSKKETLSEKQLKNLKIINNCGNDLLYLINDILDISKLEAGELCIDKKLIDVKLLMIEIKEAFDIDAIKNNINFTLNYDDRIETICSDKNRIKQIVKNLLSNAFKFSKGGNVEFIVEDLEKDIKITVKDDGIGIEKKKLVHIFERFKQADESTTRKFGGTGLGLAISKELITLLGGSISVESQINEGSSFSIVLPKNV